ncbi:4Fe-4S dicluster domain-containing protein [Clostridium weizhouense]|uniref:4Fe-4S dicluster domain-containing protein n=1 Tax=Clostridium weizhouense TaxID=2859781 RepID=A0ABS7AS93_9CLOT|nr:4Fe-4S dicluster domain-containing protein [Clostridium weizhouense]MBW6411545.1 4Fe-4S dicluster domain-containing protein [Clostridium weizhouense]
MKSSGNSFVISDNSKCIGCKACELACFAVHNKDNNVGLTVGTVKVPVIPRLHIVKVNKKTAPIQCRQCEDAPCGNVCPVGAIRKQDNIIFIDEKTCIGCKSCVLACPFGAIEVLPSYQDGKSLMQKGLKEKSDNELKNKSKVTAYKCDLCIETGTPACIKACPKDALSLVNTSEEKQNKKISAALGLNSLVNKF